MAISQAADGARHTHTHRDRDRDAVRHRQRDRDPERDTVEKSRKARRRAAAPSASASSLDDEEKLAHSRGEEKVTVAGAVVTPDRGRGLEPDAGAELLDAASLRRKRLDRLEGQHRSSRRQLSSEEEDVFASTQTLTQNMTTESHATRSSRRDGTGASASERHKRRAHRDEEKRHRRKKREGEGEDAPAQYVYGAPAEKAKTATATVRVSETRRLGRDGESEEEDRTTRSRTVKDKPREKKIKVIYMTRDEMKISKHTEPRVKTVKDDRPRESESSVHRSRTHQSRRKSVAESLPPSPPRRHTSSRILHSEARPTLKRSNTTSSHVPSTRSHIPSTAGTSPTAKRSSFIGSFFGPGIQQHHHHEPEKLVGCLTCLSDDIPRSKSAKLKCGHRMCHSCLKRIFRLSVNDPQHMPPKCCTADHIPLKHVEKLFDINFKKNWNRKFQEFSTKNRIYCPARRCGEWIKPGNMHKEDGRKYGKCGRCKTKVCCLCNGKWHGTKDCPKDEETNRLLETAKQAGWQRCYNCRTMVELKEGCNHMTCRCTAEFCMICGLKWKSCNCPWFNYEAVEEDRLNHMQIPQDIPPNGNPDAPLNVNDDRPRRIRRPRPATYHEELTERQRQERIDEALARRMQRAALNNESDDDYQGGIGDIHGVGNGAAHFMNQDYVRAAHNILTGNFDQANAAANYVMGVANARAPRRNMNERYPVPGGGRGPPPPPAPPPVLRRHTMREQAYNDALPRPRAAERIVPRRSRTDYEAEAAVHAPLGRNPLRSGQVPPQPAPRVERPREGRGERERGDREPRPSVLAGLGGRGNRVSAWRSHVEPGVEPEEGVLSMVS